MGEVDIEDLFDLSDPDEPKDTQDIPDTPTPAPPKLERRCPYRFLKGKRKGEICDCRIYKPDQDLCSKHPNSKSATAPPPPVSVSTTGQEIIKLPSHTVETQTEEEYFDPQGDPDLPLAPEEGEEEEEYMSEDIREIQAEAKLRDIYLKISDIKNIYPPEGRGIGLNKIPATVWLSQIEKFLSNRSSKNLISLGYGACCKVLEDSAVARGKDKMKGFALEMLMNQEVSRILDEISEDLGILRELAPGYQLLATTFLFMLPKLV